MRRSDPDASSEARDIVRRAVGEASGLTIKAQIRNAARNLGYPAETWRVREAWYGRAGRWASVALHELRSRLSAWRERDRTRFGSNMLGDRMAAVRDGLADLQRRFGELEAEMARVMSKPPT